MGSWDMVDDSVGVAVVKAAEKKTTPKKKQSVKLQPKKPKPADDNAPKHRISKGYRQAEHVARQHGHPPLVCMNPVCQRRLRTEGDEQGGGSDKDNDKLVFDLIDPNEEYVLANTGVLCRVCADLKEVLEPVRAIGLLHYLRNTQPDKYRELEAMPMRRLEVWAVQRDSKAWKPDKKGKK